MWVWILVCITTAGITLFLLKKAKLLRFLKPATNDAVSAQLAILEERTRHLQGLEEKIEKIKDKQDSDSRELRERLYSEYSRRLQEAVGLLRETYGKMTETTTNVLKDITAKNAEAYRQTIEQLTAIANKLESAFKILEQREHTQMREEMKALKQKIEELERDPLRVQVEELAEARTAQAVHEQSVKVITTTFWRNNGEVQFKEKIGQYQPDVYINNHRIKIVADEVTTADAVSIKAKVKRVAEYMHGLNVNVGYVIIPNAGVDPEALKEIKRTVPERGLYIVRLTEYAVHLQVWYDIAMTGVVEVASLVEKGHNFLQILEPLFEEFLAIVQNLEQRDEKEFKYRQNRYKEIKFFPEKILEAIERNTLQKPESPVQTKIAEYNVPKGGEK
jgi:sortase (surface protein transpeptidase)